MENRRLRQEPLETLSHLISTAALQAVSTDGRATEKLRAVDDMSFKEARVFKVCPGGGATAMTKVTGGAKKKYANHFCNMQNPLARGIGIICLFEDDGKKLHGYIPYYSFKAGVFGDEIMYAFFHKGIDAVVMLMAAKADASPAQVMHSMGEPVPFGKICAWCGVQTGAQGEKLKKCPCKTVRYCSKECQSAHWADHRPCCSRGAYEAQ
jgi:hypothetical protein